MKKSLPLALILTLLSAHLLSEQTFASGGGLMCSGWSGIVEVSDDQPFLGGCWFMGGTGTMTINWELTSSTNTNPPVIWPHHQGEILPAGSGDQYINWDPEPPDCASHHVVVNIQDQSGATCSCDFTLVHLCPNDPPCVLNECGICENNGSCPEPPGPDDPPCVYDACGVCNGDGSSCGGNPECVEDACGVCYGDGSSCNCIEVNLDPFLIALDSNSRALKTLNDIALKHAKSLGCPGTDFESFQEKRSEGAGLADQNWLLANGIPRKDRSCGPSIQCNTIEVQSNKDAVLKNSKNLVKLIRKTSLSCGAPDKKFTQVLKKAKKLHKKNVKLASRIPESVQLCSEIH